MRQKKAQEKNSLKKSSKHPVSVNKLSYNSSETLKFNKSDIVWAKITGYPWWPAIVTTVPGQKDVDKRNDDMRNNYPWSNVHHNVKAEYRVDFIADETHAFLKKNFLLNYLSNRDRLYVEGLQFSSRKRRYFQMAVNEADQLQQVLQLSKNQVHQCKNNKAGEESESMEIQSDSQMNESLDQQGQNNQESSENSQKQYTPQQNRLTRLRKSRMNQNKKEQQSISISNQSKSKSLFQKKNTKNVDNCNKNKNEQPLIVVNSSSKRGRPSNKSNIINQIKTRQQQQINKCQVEINKDLFPKFEIYQKDIELVSKKYLQDKQQILSQNHLEVQNQNVERSASTQKIYQLSINRFVDSQCKKTEQLLSDLLIKYNLHKIEEVQENYQNKKTFKSKQQNFQFFENSGSLSIKANNKKIFVKNIFSGLGKKKHSKKHHHQKSFFGENDIYSENLSIVGKLKQNNQESIPQQLQKFLIQTSKKYTARKIYSIVRNILKKNSIETIDQQIQTSIRQRCKRISKIIFDQDQVEICKTEKKSSLISKKKGKNNDENSFLTAFKRKLEQNVNFIRFFSMQNWDFLSQMASFPTDLCIQIKSFQNYLQKSCHLNMSNEQKFEDIIKQINIENQKTAFSCLHPPNQMQIENDSANVLSGRFVSNQGNQQLKIEKKPENIFIQTK